MFLTLAFSILPSLAGVPGLLPTSLWFLELKILQLKLETFFFIWELSSNLKFFVELETEFKFETFFLS